jgi:hypothetical protein
MLSSLYLLFCIGTLVKFWADFESLRYFEGLLQGTGFSVDRLSNALAGYARVALYVVGSVVVTIFIYQARSMAGSTEESG